MPFKSCQIIPRSCHLNLLLHLISVWIQFRRLLRQNPYSACPKAFLRHLLFSFGLPISPYPYFLLHAYQLKCSSSFLSCALRFCFARMCLLHTLCFPTALLRPVILFFFQHVSPTRTTFNNKVRYILSNIIISSVLVRVHSFSTTHIFSRF